MRQEIVRLEGELEKLRKENDDLQYKVRNLTMKLAELRAMEDDS
jgi:predicted  nucleic acid-binding Zn-ribbon protein